MSTDNIYYFVIKRLSARGGAHVDNLLVVSPGNWNSCSQANSNNPRGDSYEVPQEKSDFTAEDRWRRPKACALVRADTSGGRTWRRHSTAVECREPNKGED